MPRSLRLGAALCALSVLATTPAGAGSIEKAKDATHYIGSRQHDDGSFPGFSPMGSTADAALTFVAADRAPKKLAKALDYMESEAIDDVTSVGQKAKVVMAIVAGGRDPRAVGGHHNLVQEIIDSQQESGQYGDGSDFVGVASHALAILALSAAGEEIPQNASQFLADAQCPDGGWQYDRPHSEGEDDHCVDPSTDDQGNPTDFATSDTNTTSLAVQALAVAPPVTLSVDPFTYFDSARDPEKHGWRYSHEAELFGSDVFTDANSTALVIQAYSAEGMTAPKAGRKALRALAYPLVPITCASGNSRDPLSGAYANTWKLRGGELRRFPSEKSARAEKENGGPTVIGATIGAVLGLLEQPLPLPEESGPPVVSCGAP